MCKVLSKYSWLCFLASKHCQEGLKVQHHQPTKHNLFPLLLLGKQSSVLLFCGFLRSLIQTEKFTLAEVMLTAPIPPLPMHRSQRKTPSWKERMLLMLWCSVILFFAKKKKKEELCKPPQLAFLRNSAWCDRPRHQGLVLLAFLKQR